MKFSNQLLLINGAKGLSTSAIPPLLALLLTQTFSMEHFAICLMLNAGLRFFLTPVLSPSVDKINPAKIVIFSELINSIASLFISYKLWIQSISFEYWIMFFSINAIIHSFETTAAIKISTRLVEKKLLIKFISLESSILYSSRMVGPIVSGLALLFTSPSNALTFMLCAPSVITIPLSLYIYIKTKNTFDNEIIKYNFEIKNIYKFIQNWKNEVTNGFLMRWAIPVERYLAIQVFFELIFIIPTFGILLPKLVTYAHWDNSWLGWIEASSGVGLVLGALLAPKFIKIIGNWKLCIGSALNLSICVAFCGFFVENDNKIGLSIALFLANFLLAIRIQAGGAQRRMAIPERVRAQFAGVHITLNTLATQIGIASATIWVNFFNCESWFYFSATVLFMLALTILYIPKFKELISLEIIDAEGFYEKKYPTAFKYA